MDINVKHINPVKKNTHKSSFLIVIILFIIGISVRVFLISDIPNGLNQDEASIGYDAFSIMTTGQDRAGNSYPIHLKSWGSGQNALYAYLSIPFIHFLGLNSFSIRIINCIFSCISLLIFYLIFNLTTNKKTSIIALALLAICPWSIMAGRWGLESNIFPILFLIAVYFLIKGIKISSAYLYLSFTLFAISLYAYGTSYLILPFFFILIIPYLIINKLIPLKVILYSLVVFFIIALPIFLFVMINHFDFNTIKIGEITIPKLDSNRTTTIFNLFSDNPLINAFKNLGRLIYIIILQTDNNTYNALPSSGTVYHLSLPFLFIGLFNVVKNKTFLHNPLHYIFLTWFICSVVLGISSQININRINILFFPILYFTVLGITDLHKHLKSRLRKSFLQILFTFYSVLFFAFSANYFFVSPQKQESSFYVGLKDVIHYSEEKLNDSPIYISYNTINMPYIYISFFTQMDADVFRNKVVYGKNHGGFIDVLSIGKYSFGNDLFRDNHINLIKNEDAIRMNINTIEHIKFESFLFYDLYNK